jgi:hypothetical protein
MRYIHLVAYGLVVGNFLNKTFRKLYAQYLGKEEKVLFFHFQNDDPADHDDVMLTLYIGNNLTAGDFQQFIDEIKPCVMATGWRLVEIEIQKMVPVSRWGDDMYGLEKCLRGPSDVERFRNAYYGMMRS